MSTLYYKALDEIQAQGEEGMEPDEYYDLAEAKVNRMSNTQLLELICNLMEDSP